MVSKLFDKTHFSWIKQALYGHEWKCDILAAKYWKHVDLTVLQLSIHLSDVLNL